jgi:hypothetical protein
MLLLYVKKKIKKAAKQDDCGHLARRPGFLLVLMESPAFRPGVRASER